MIDQQFRTALLDICPQVAPQLAGAGWSAPYVVYSRSSLTHDYFLTGVASTRVVQYAVQVFAETRGEVADMQRAIIELVHSWREVDLGGVHVHRAYVQSVTESFDAFDGEERPLYTGIVNVEVSYG